jgi:hypothetical protein
MHVSVPTVAEDATTATEVRCRFLDVFS